MLITGVFGLERSKKESTSFVELLFRAGDPDVACILTIHANATTRLQRAGKGGQEGEHLDSEHLDIILDSRSINVNRLVDWFVSDMEKNGFDSYILPLKACASAAEIYKLLPDATISTTILSQSLAHARWIPSIIDSQGQELRLTLSKAEVFACIAMFDSGICNFDPAGLKQVFAMSSRNSIYVAGPLLCDPYEIGRVFEVRRVVGNIGRPGISLLIPPPEPKMLTSTIDSWHQLNYLTFNGEPENCFGQISIHLSFTAYEMPLQTENTDQHIIDRPARLIETLVSVYDGQKWVADLNVMECLSGKKITRLTCRSRDRITGLGGDYEGANNCQATYSNIFSGGSMVSVDNWEEFLQPSDESISVVRAHQNWPARLAFTVASVQQGRHPILLPPDVCWSCCKQMITVLDSKKLLLIL